MRALWHVHFLEVGVAAVGLGGPGAQAHAQKTVSVSLFAPYCLQLPVPSCSLAALERGAPMRLPCLGWEGNVVMRVACPALPPPCLLAGILVLALEDIRGLLNMKIYVSRGGPLLICWLRCSSGAAAKH